LLWVDTGQIAANQHNGSYALHTGHADQDFRFPRIYVRFRGNSGLLKRAIYAPLDGSFRLRRSHSLTLVTLALRHGFTGFMSNRKLMSASEGTADY